MNLLTDQYRNASNLNTRIQLHEQYSTNKYGWHRWVFDQLKLSPKSRILELGCGSGILWLKNIERLPKDWDIILSDFSLGMLEEAQRNLSTKSQHFKFVAIDAQSIPFENKSFDAVIANHMLYHVPNRDKAFSEIRRILRPGGRFYASTNGQVHMRELEELVRKIVLNAPKFEIVERFSLENGFSQLSRYFSKVTLRRYEDSLVITEAKPLIAYILSGRFKSIFIGDKLASLIRLVEGEITSRGAICIIKDSGIFEAIRRDENAV